MPGSAHDAPSPPGPRAESGGRPEIVAETHVGHVRESNEDAYAIISDLDLVIVADGMGGHAGGEVASALVVESVEREIRGIGAFASAAPSMALTAAIRAANDAVRASGAEQPALRGMGSTVVAALVLGRTAHIAHAGDSRAYRVRGTKAERLTRDHSLVEEYLAENPGATEDDLEGVYRHLVTRAVGASPALDVDVTVVDCEPDDVLVFCSDGLTGPVDDPSIGRIVGGALPNGGVKAAAHGLVEAALAGGGPDNVTVALVRIT